MLGGIAVRKREPWRVFGVKALVMVGVMVAVGAAFMSRYRIGIDPQDIKCIPGKTFYLVDLSDRDLQRGRIYAFHSQGVEPFFRDGTRMVKFLRGVPGDQVEIRKDQSILVNGQEQGWGLSLAMDLKQPITSFMGKKTLQAGEFWFMGLSDVSFDSRYWGSVSNEQIIGRAYPLF